MLNSIQKALMVQSCINCYYDENGRGVHGEVDWSFIKGGFNGISAFNIENSEGWTGIATIPGIGEAGIVAHEGSSNKNNGVDWKRNFDFKKIKDIQDEADDGAEKLIPYGNTDTKVRIHQGFYTAFQQVRSLTRDFAKWCHKKGLPYGVAGHSLGGAVATLDFIDKQYMFNTEMGIAEENLRLFGYAAASPAVFNFDGAVSFNKRAGKRFHNEWYGNDTVHDTPPFLWMGYTHVNAQKRYSNFRDTVLFPITHAIQWGTLGFLPSAGVWDHDPRKLLAAIEGKPIPHAKLDSRK